MITEFQKTFKSARAVSTPIFSVRTPDQAMTINSIIDVLKNGKEVPILAWDCIQGVRWMNEAGFTVCWISILGQKLPLPTDQTQINSAREKLAGATLDPTATLARAQQLPGGTVLLMQNMHLFWEKAPVRQAAWNLRDTFKSNQRTLVMLTDMGATPPSELQCAVPLTEELPTLDELGTLVDEQMEAAELEIDKGPALRATAVDAICGLPAFDAEQVIAMSFYRRKEDGKIALNAESLWKRKCAAISQVRGLSVKRGGPKFKDVGGNSQIKQFFWDMFGGVEAPRVLVLLDEMEKMMAGSADGGSESATKTELSGAMLTEMEDRGYTGLMEFGVPGASKTYVVNAAAAEFGIPLITLSIPDLMEKFVGSSNENFRKAFAMIHSVSQGRAFFVGTMNSMTNISGPMRRRFCYGEWMFDLPSKEERTAIWKIHRTAYGIDPSDKIPNDEGWTGAEIRNCFAPHHRLLGTDLKWRSADKFRVGDTILGFDEHGPRRKYRGSRILAIDYAIEPTFSVHLESGHRFIVTRDHRFLCHARGKGAHWKRTDELQKNFSLPRLLDPWTTEDSWEAGWLAGMYDGEGFFSQLRRDLSIGQNDGVILDRLALELSARHFKFANLAAYGKKAAEKGRRCRKLRILNGIPEIYRLLGSIRPQRLIGKIDFDTLGRLEHRLGLDRIVAIESRKRAEIIRITTSTGTLVVDGYPHHNCCRMAYQMRRTLIQVSEYISPVSRTMADEINQMRRLASGKFKNAAAPGVYTWNENPSVAPQATGPTRRKIAIDPNAN